MKFTRTTWRQIIAWLWLPVIAVLLLAVEALENHSEQPCEEAGDVS